MSENKDNSAFKKLLNKLQEDSWQLELLISGFAIFGLFYAIEPINKALIESVKGAETIFINLFIMVRFFLYIMIFNLTLHIVLRGLWIGSLGLRYVSGDIDYKSLNYSEKFTKYLKRKVGSFDDYIGKLEDYCSVIFAITFLLIFYVIAISIIVIIYRLIVSYVFNNESFPDWLAYGLGWLLIAFMAVGTILTFIDSVTGGWLKKKQKIVNFYFPFYLLFSFITLSFLYRPLVYNFLDDKFGRRIFLRLIPFYSLIFVFNSFYYQKSNFFTGHNDSNKIIANHVNYRNLQEDDYHFVVIDFSIQSQVITDPYLKIYKPYYKKSEDLIFEFSPNLKPKKDKRGLHTNIYTKSDTEKDKLKKDSLQTEYVKTFNKIYKIRIDSITYQSDFIIDKIKREKFGFAMFMGVKNLNEGKHLLTISRQIKKDSIGTKVVSKIPFWYYKN